MRILVRLVQNWKFSEIISRFCATLSAIGCSMLALSLEVICNTLQLITLQHSATDCNWCASRITHFSDESYLYESCLIWMSHFWYVCNTLQLITLQVGAQGGEDPQAVESKSNSFVDWSIHERLAARLSLQKLHNGCIYRVAKIHRMPYFYRSFSAKEPYNSWHFCGKWTAT